MEFVTHGDIFYRQIFIPNVAENRRYRFMFCTRRKLGLKIRNAFLFSSFFRLFLLKTGKTTNWKVNCFAFNQLTWKARKTFQFKNEIDWISTDTRPYDDIQWLIVRSIWFSNNSIEIRDTSIVTIWQLAETRDWKSRNTWYSTGGPSSRLEKKPMTGITVMVKQA